MRHDDSGATVAEFTIEPIVEGELAPPVRAAIGAAEAAGLVVEIGPFGTSVEGESAAVLAAVPAVPQRDPHRLSRARRLRARFALCVAMLLLLLLLMMMIMMMIMMVMILMMMMILFAPE